MPTHHPPTARLFAFAFAIAGVASTASAQWAEKPHFAHVPHHHFNAPRYNASATPASWSSTRFPPSIQLFNGATNPLLMTDGSVIMQDVGDGTWARLVPDESGSYVNGSWTSIGPLPEGYNPITRASAVLADGRVIVEGGEFNQIGGPNGEEGPPVQTTLGAIFDPNTGWTLVAPPPGWSTIGDGPSVVLADGTYMQGNCCTNQAALLDAKTLTWTPVGTGKFGTNENESWTLLPNHEVLTVDTYFSNYAANGMNSEIFNHRTGTWQSAGSTTVQLWDSQAACGDQDPSLLIGPGILRPDGTVFYTGADTCPSTPGKTAIYDTRTRRWSAGPTFPGDLDIAGGPAAVEPNGKVLIMASAGLFQHTSQFLEWDGKSLTPATPSTFASEDTSAQGMMVVLPTGQILLTDDSEDVEIYTPEPGFRHEWAPRIWWIEARLRRDGFELSSGQSYEIFGRRFNGMTQGASYSGGGSQSATNYPLVRITNNATGHVFYCRTHDHSSMAVASEAPVSTHFDIPSNIETGAGKLVVVANGIPSEPQDVTVF
jgi:hypothetical protein